MGGGMQPAGRPGACIRRAGRISCRHRTIGNRKGPSMASDKKIRVAVVGLGFGAEFIPIYQSHPHAEMYAICRRSKKELDESGDHFGVKVRYTDYAKLLADPNVDAVHINSPIPDHAAQSL